VVAAGNFHPRSFQSSLIVGVQDEVDVWESVEESRPNITYARRRQTILFMDVESCLKGSNSLSPDNVRE
jgi:hypothetical protein